jgi:hypothetical protein
MCRITERLWFVGGQAVRFCSKAGIGRESKHSKPCYYQNGHKNCPANEKPLTAQVDLGKIIDVVGRNLCFLSVYMGNPRLSKANGLA